MNIFHAHRKVFQYIHFCSNVKSNPLNTSAQTARKIKKCKNVIRFYSKSQIFVKTANLQFGRIYKTLLDQ